VESVLIASSANSQIKKFHLNFANYLHENFVRLGSREMKGKEIEGRERAGARKAIN
jgi:hypothetical protein